MPRLLKRALIVLGWIGLVLIAVAAILFIFRRPIMARLGIRPPSGAAEVADVEVPEGFTITVFAEDLSNPRFMTVGPDGTLFLAERGRDRVVALPDENRDGSADAVVVVAEELDRPSSLAFRPGSSDLYVGETSRVTRLRLDGSVVTGREVVIDGLPSRRLHFTTTVLFDLDDRLYLAMGSSCNVCREDDPRLAAVEVYDPDGSNRRPFMVGLRNAVGLALNPETSEVWATNNGRDLMGNDLPPETVYVLEEGADAGWPRCHAGTLADPRFGDEGACDEVAQPIIIDTAHSAPLGASFYTGDSFPERYRGDFFMAYHGSWNRVPPTGYKVVRVPIDDRGVPGAPEDFAAGWLKEDGSSSGRPVDVVVAADGSLLVSDDKAGLVYRIAYRR